jgi:hypothetical protein
LNITLTIPDEVLAALINISLETGFESTNECIEHILTGFCLGTIGVIEDVRDELES